MKAENEMTLTFPSRSANEAFARAAVACFAAHLSVRRAAESLKSPTPYVVNHRSALGCHVENVAQHEHRVDASGEW